MTRIRDRDEAAQWVRRGHRLSQQAHILEAEACYQRALAIAPDHAMAHNNLGWVREQRGDTRGAIAEYEHALRLDGSLRLARRNLASLLARLGRRRDGLSLWQAAARENVDRLAELDALTDRAMDAGNLVIAAEHAAIHAALRFGTRWYPAGLELADLPERSMPLRMLSIGKLRHDSEQFTYLQKRSILGREFTSIIAHYEKLIVRMASAGSDTRIPLTGDAAKDIGGVYGRLVHVRHTPRLRSALSDRWSGGDVEDEYLAYPPGVVVIDNFLSEEALQELRAFCLESTVWSTNRYAHGRLGAFFRDGFNCPLLIQIAAELHNRLPHIIGFRYPLRQMWGFKYDESLSSNSVHADFAAINVNFWITPSTANLGPHSGGLLIYDVEAPLDWDFETYNRRGDLIEQFLRMQGAQTIEIPYRQNRAVIFNSDLFHATAPMSFRREYENRRINVTLLYGDRANAIHRL